MTVWEYSVHELQFRFGDDISAGWLNHKGQEGWELVSVTQYVVKGDLEEQDLLVFHCFYKRPAKADTSEYDANYEAYLRSQGEK